MNILSPDLAPQRILVILSTLKVFDFRLFRALYSYPTSYLDSRLVSN